jgi:WD40 repeat protein
MQAVQNFVTPLGYCVRLMVPALLLATCLGSAEPSQAQDQSVQGPFLRVDAGMHSAPITATATDAQNKYIATASWDKTIRVWSLPDGRPLKTLRCPIGPGHQGQFYAVAISPDGDTIAAAGYTSSPSEQENIYFFDRVSGAIQQRISGLPETVDRLTYSKNGRLLVAGLGGLNGIRVYDAMAGYRLIASDTAYGGEVRGADFDAAGQLVTSSYDGFIRLYSPGHYNSPFKKSRPLDERLYRVAFSPDGKRIAVGYAFKPRVQVLSARDLAPLYTPGLPSSAAPDWVLGSVAWSAGGNQLLAGGASSGTGVILRWADGGRGRAQDVGKPRDSVRELLLLRDGSILFGSMTPEFGIISATGETRTLQGPGQLDFRTRDRTGLLVSEDATTVEALSINPQRRVRLTLRQRRVDLDAEPDTGLFPAVTEAPGVAVTGWQDSASPALNGRALQISPNELARSVAIAPDAKSFVLGNDWTIRDFNADGHQIWIQDTEAAVFNADVARSGGVVVSVEGDGTFRWRRLSDGVELLAAFISRDGQRWVSWTPQGYYDASAGGDDLIGWQVNNGPDRAPDFFAVGQFRERFYRPDVIEHVLDPDTLDVDKALAKADESRGHKTEKVAIRQVQPPVIEILDPKGGLRTSETHLTLTYRVRSPAAPVTEIKALVDDRPLQLDKDQQPGAKAGTDIVRTIAIDIPHAGATVSLVALNQFGPSQAASVKIEWAGPAEEVRPDLYILAVGVRQYKNPTKPLQFPDKDATDFVAQIRRQENRFYLHVTPHLLVNEQATIEAIRKEFVWLKRQMGSRDVAVIFLSGHGDKETASSYDFLPYDADKDNPELTYFHGHEIKYLLGDMVGLKLLFVDSCFSGNVFNEEGRKGGDEEVANQDDLANQLSTPGSGTVVFTSSQGKELSREDEKWGHGAFTLALLEGLQGKADHPEIHISQLDAYVEGRVKELTNNRQRPTMVRPSGMTNVPIARAD